MQLRNNKWIIAGPCSAESEEQVFDTAVALQAIGISTIRASLWKPRTRPDCFEGAGSKGLAWLQRVQRELHLSVATEVATPGHVRLCMDHGIDVLWIGARTTTNPFMVQQIADEVGHYEQKPIVLVKNPISPDINLWFGAIERFEKVGVEQIGAVHRGFYSPYSAPLRNMPNWSVPIELKRKMPHIPVICDPSHLTGDATMVGDVATQAIQIGFDGLMIECHICPQEALSDPGQQITPLQLDNLLKSIESKIGGHSKEEYATTALLAWREQIDEIDNELWQLIAKRLDIAEEIGQIKHQYGLPILQSERYNDILQKRLQWASGHHISAEVVQKMVEILHEEAIRRQL